MPSQTMLQVHALSFDYSDRPLLCNIQLSLARGRLLHLRGGNGSGKTTLLRLLAGLLPLSEGKILWNKRSIHEDLPAFQRSLCYVGHKRGISPALTVRENCYFDVHWQRRAVSLPELLERFELQALADSRCSELSEGQKRRVALLRLAMTDAPLWLLDEPLVALDPAATRLLASCIEQHLAAQGMVVMTSHQNLPDCVRDYEVYTL